MGVLYDRSRSSHSLPLWIGLIGLLLSCVKSILGLAHTTGKKIYMPELLFVGIVGKLVVVCFLWVSIIRQKEIP